MKLPADFSLSVEPEISLMPLPEEAADILFNLVDANREYLREFMGWLDRSTSSTDSRIFIKEANDKLVRLETITLGIFYTGILAGVISLHQIDLLNQCASIGYWIAQKYQGKGLVTKSTQTLIQYAFQELGLHRLEIRCAVHNYKSQKIALNLGFQKEGLLKKAISHYGIYYDAYIYGLVCAKHLS